MDYAIMDSNMMYLDTGPSDEERNNVVIFHDRSPSGVDDPGSPSLDERGKFLDEFFKRGLRLAFEQRKVGYLKGWSIKCLVWVARGLHMIHLWWNGKERLRFRIEDRVCLRIVNELLVGFERLPGYRRMLRTSRKIKRDSTIAQMKA